MKFRESCAVRLHRREENMSRADERGREEDCELGAETEHRLKIERKRTLLEHAAHSFEMTLDSILIPTKPRFIVN